MHFRHISAKIQPKNLKQHFDWGGWTGLPGYALEVPLNSNLVVLIKKNLLDFLKLWKLDILLRKIKKYIK